MQDPHVHQQFVTTVEGALSKSVSQHIAQFGRCTIALTGGRAAKWLYQSISNTASFDLGKTTLFFGDERLVAPESDDSNYFMAMKALFPTSIPTGCVVEAINGSSTDYWAEANRYSSLLPKSIDIVLLSVGEDGHIASLFPGDKAVSECYKNAVPVIAPKQPNLRITITPKVIKLAKAVFVMAVGEGKGHILAKALEAPTLVEELPVRLTLGSTWILDKSAARVFMPLNQNNLHNTRILYA